MLRYEVGWEDPEEAYKWYLIEAVAPQDALALHNAGWGVEEALEWLGAHYDRTDKVGEFWLDRPQEALKWKETGWENAKEAYEWIRAGWSDPEEAMKWKKTWSGWEEMVKEVYPPESGLKPSEALVVAVGVMAESPKRLHLLKESGWSDPKEALRWLLQSYSWAGNDADLAKAYEWYNAGWDNPEEAYRWYDAGWENAKEALRWKKAGFWDPEVAFEWKKTGLWNKSDLEELKVASRAYYVLGIKDPHEAKRMAKSIVKNRGRNVGR